MGPQITLLQPRHNYAGSEGKGHIYLSAPLLSVKARLKRALPGKKIKFIDANLENPNYSQMQGVLGINLVGAPYIPEVLKIIEKVPKQVTILLGGQIISSLTDEEFRGIFNKERNNIFNGNDNTVLESVFEIRKGSIPSAEDVSLTEEYSEISDDDMKQYLEREFSIYVSQGCKYNCSFCQAKKAKPEKYRNLSMLEEELSYLTSKALSFGSNKLEFYLSNLDILQTPMMFSQFLDIIEGIKDKNPGFIFKFRGLCGVESFLSVYYTDPNLLIRAQNLGLDSIGYGIDGGTPDVWRMIGKQQNFRNMQRGEDFSDQEKAIETIRLTRELGINPEILMVFGHPGETEKSLKAAYDFCIDMLSTYGALPRPHVSKTIIPGAKAWSDPKNRDTVRQFIENPNLFQALDYTALPSEYTHPDEQLRESTRKWYIEICDLSKASTKYIIPNTPYYQDFAKKKNTTVEKMNYGKFDR